MHLAQIAALPMATEVPTDSGRTAHPAAQGEGFLAAFSGEGAAAAPEPQRSGPPAGARQVLAALGDLVDTPETETLETGENAKTDSFGAVLSRAGRGPETETGDVIAPDETETRPARGEVARGPVADADISADGYSVATPAMEPSSDASSGAARPDNRGLPEFAASVPMSAPHGAPPARPPEGYAQGSTAAGPFSDMAGGGVPPPSAPVAAQAGQIVAMADAAATPRAVHAGVAGQEKPAQKNQNGVPEAGANALRGIVFPVAPQVTTTDPQGRGSVQSAAMMQATGPVGPAGPVAPKGISDGQTARVQPVDPARSAEVRSIGADQATPAVHGQGVAAAKGNPMPTGPQELVPGAQRFRSDTRPAAEAEAPSPPPPPQAETPAASRSMAATAPIHSGADSGASPSVGGSGAPESRAGLFGADPEMPDAMLGDARATARGTSPATLPVLQSPDTPRQVALQIAEVVRASGDRAVELKLQPEELGRVQLTMSQDATGTLTVSLNVERPETLDLLRRNIELLGADLHELGYQKIDFSFHGDGAGGEPDARPGRGDGPGARDADAAKTIGTLSQSGGRRTDGPGDGIDIRI